MHKIYASKKKVVADFTRAESSRVKRLNLSARTDESNEQLVLKCPEDAQQEVKTLLAEHKRMKSALTIRSGLLCGADSATFEDLNRKIQVNAYNTRLAQLTKAFAEHAQVIVTINPDGKMIAFATGEDDELKAVPYPEWCQAFDVYRNQRVQSYGKRSAYHNDNRNERGNQSNRGRFRSNSLSMRDTNRGDNYQRQYRGSPAVAVSGDGNDENEDNDSQQ